MSADLAELLESIREECSAGTWTRGVALTRGKGVSCQSVDGEEAVFKVKPTGKPVPFTATLYLEDEDWNCECPSREGACEHVVAAAIALKTARDEGREPIRQAPTRARVVHKLHVHDGHLGLERVVVAPSGDESPLGDRIRNKLAGKEGGGALEVTKADLRVEGVLQGTQRRVLPTEVVLDLIGALHGADVTLDGDPVKPQLDRMVPRVRLVDGDPDGIDVIVEADPSVTAVVAPGVVRCGENLHAMGAIRLSGDRLQHLPQRKHHPPATYTELVTEVVPGLRKSMSVEVQTDRLPSLDSDVAPRVTVVVEQRGSNLSVLPRIVYGDPPQARVEGDTLVHIRGGLPVRNRDRERGLANRVSDELGITLGRRTNVAGRDAVKLSLELQGWRGTVEGDAHRKVLPDTPLEGRMVGSGTRLGVSFSATDSAGGSVTAGADAVLEAWDAGDAFVPLDGGGWAPIPAAFLEVHAEHLRALLLAKGDREEVPAYAAATLLSLADALDEPRPPAFEGLAAMVDGFSGLGEPDLPEELDGVLRDYQRAGAAWLGFLRNAGLGGILADDMGLGKTLQALSSIRGRTLVVCPTSLMHNWIAEIRRFRPGLSHALYHGPKRALDPDADVTITSYGVLRLDAESLSKEAWDAAILDEAQTIKNPDSQVARAAYGLDAAFRLTLSGTPVENRLEELWSQLHFCNPGLLGGRAGFKSRYADPIAAGVEPAAVQLRGRVKPFVLRRLKSAVAPELPPRTDVDVLCVLDDEERALYDAIAHATREEVVKKLDAGGNVMAALEALLRLRQASCHRGLVPGQDATHSAKSNRLFADLDEAVAGGHRALVFSQWTSFLDLIQAGLQTRGIGHVRLDGSTRDRAGVVEAFQDPSGPPVMLLSLKAGGTGLNLTAADHVFMMDPWWNPAVEDQAADRAHRIGQDRPVTVRRLIAKDTVEERILALQAKKRGLADAALAGSAAAVGLTRDDLLSLLA